MMSPARRPLAALVLAASLTGAGCLGRSAATRLYVLAPAETTAAPSAASLSVGLGPVSVPVYLDRPQLVTRPAADRIELSELDQWAEPLRDGITRVLAEDLAGQMRSVKVAIYPWRSQESIHYQVVVDITRLDGPAGGDLALEARWRVLDLAGKEVAEKTTRLAEPTGGPGYSATVSAMSRALAALSRDMAEVLTALPR